MGGRGLDSSGSGYITMASSCEHGNESSGSIKRGSFLTDEELSAFQEGLRSLQLVNNRMTATLHNDLSAEEISVHMPLFHSPKHLVFVLLVTPRCRFQEIIYDVRRFSLKTSNLKKWQGVRTKLIQSNVGSARHIDQTAVYRCHMIGLRTLHGFPTAKLVVLAEASCTTATGGKARITAHGYSPLV